MLHYLPSVQIHIKFRLNNKNNNQILNSNHTVQIHKNRRNGHKKRRPKQPPSEAFTSFNWWSLILNKAVRWLSFPLAARALVTLVMVADVDGEDLSRCLSGASFMRFRSVTAAYPTSAALDPPLPPLSLYISFSFFLLLLLWFSTSIINKNT